MDNVFSKATSVSVQKTFVEAAFLFVDEESVLSNATPDVRCSSDKSTDEVLSTPSFCRSDLSESLFDLQAVRVMSSTIELASKRFCLTLLMGQAGKNTHGVIDFIKL